MKVRKIVLIVLILVYQLNLAQGSSLPFLSLNSDARSAAMGNSTMAESKSMYLYTNPTSFLLDTINSTYVSYTSVLLPKFSGKRSTFNVGAIGYNFEKQNLSIGFRYLKGLEFTRIDDFGEVSSRIIPFDFSIDVGYARELSNNLSAFITGAFIESCIENSSYIYNVSSGGYYRDNFKIQNKDMFYALGLGFYNLGTTIKSIRRNYDQPCYLGFGSSFGMKFIDNHEVSISLSTRYFVYSTIYDSGITTSFGVEYELHKLFSIRIGRYIEQGNELTTLGLGFNYKYFSFDLSYQNGQKNSLFWGVNLKLPVLNKHKKK